MFRSPSGFQIIVWQLLISVICGITLSWGVDRVWMKIFDHRKLFPGRREEAVPKKIALSPENVMAQPSVPKGMTKITDALLIKNPIDLSQCLCESPGGWRQANFGRSAIRCWGVANLHPENASISKLRQHEYPRQSFIQSHHALPAGLQTWVVAVTKKVCDADCGNFFSGTRHPERERFLFHWGKIGNTAGVVICFSNSQRHAKNAVEHSAPGKNMHPSRHCFKPYALFHPVLPDAVECTLTKIQEGISRWEDLRCLVETPASIMMHWRLFISVPFGWMENTASGSIREN